MLFDHSFATKDFIVRLSQEQNFYTAYLAPLLLPTRFFDIILPAER